MEVKKSPRANLQSRRVLLLEIGLIVSVGAMIAVFSYGKPEKMTMQLVAPEAVIDNDVIIPTVQEQKPAPARAAYVASVDVLQLIDNHREIKVDIDFPPETDDIYIPVKPSVDKVVESADDIFIVVETMPKFMGGGLAKFRDWVISRLRYPVLAAENNVEGQVVLSFVIEKDGSLGQIEVLQSVDPSLSEEAIRVLKTSPAWKPGMQRTMPVRVKYTLPVQFRLSN